jgi:hypothetical protein
MDKECAMPFLLEMHATGPAAALSSGVFVFRSETAQGRHASPRGMATIVDTPSLLGPLAAFDRSGVAVLHTDLWRRRHATAS